MLVLMLADRSVPMALTDPQKINPGSGSVDLPRVNVKGSESQYSSADGLLTITASTVRGKRKRTVFRVDQNKIAADPFKPADNVQLSQSVYIVCDRPLAGFTNAETLELLSGLIAQGAASSNAVFTKVIGGES
jgi:hypothetical protein